MAKQIIPNEARVAEARFFVEGVVYTDSIYAFLGYSKPLDVVAPELEQSVRNSIIDPFKNMIYGKRVLPTDVKQMVRNIQWESGTVYDEYDDRQSSEDQDFFVVIEEGTYFHYWKCISNAGDSESTVAPVFADLNPSDIYYQTADGYVWKYMATVSDAVYNRHSTGLYSPIEANNEVSLAAVPGSVDHLAVDDAGEGYSNHLVGTFAANDVRVNGNTLTYGLSSNSDASFTNTYYTNCVMYISSGIGAGQFRRITHSYSNANGKFVVVNSAFTVPPVATSEFEINPLVRIIGLQQTVNAEGRAVINTVGNTVHSVEMLARGLNYVDAEAEILFSETVDVTREAIVRPVMSPYGGHGYDCMVELNATRVSIACTFEGTESNTVPATNKFQQVGILINPTFDDVVLNYSNTLGTFVTAENVSAIRVRRLTTGNVTDDSSILTLDTADEYLAANDTLYLEGDLSQRLAVVNNIINSTAVYLDSNTAFSGNVDIWLANTKGYAVVSDIIDANSMGVSNMYRHYMESGDMIVGHSSGAVAYVDNVSRQEVTKGFSTYIGMTKILAIPSVGSFVEDEKVFQGVALANSSSNAYLHSVSLDSGVLTMYVVDRIGDFANVELGTITGANSGAVAVVTRVMNPEVVSGSGSIIHLENIAAVDRNPNQRESLSTILEF